MIVFDELWPGGPRLARDDASFRLSTDSVLLAHFAECAKPKSIIDLGSGAGVLSVLLAHKYPESKLIGVEIQPEAAEISRLSLSENGYDKNATILLGDLREHRTLLKAGECDLVVSNPPYFPVRAGHSAPDEGRRIAREEICCTLADLCTAAAYLCRWGGTFCLVHRPERLSEICCLTSEAGLEPKRLRMVQYRSDAPPSLLLLECRRGAKPGLSFEPPLLLTNADGTETDEVKAIYHRT